MLEKNLTNDFYRQYVGYYAKRFYTSFEKENMGNIIDFKLTKRIRGLEAHFRIKLIGGDWQPFWWDVEDCIIITNKPLKECTDNRVITVLDPEYDGYNPFTKEIEQKINIFP